MFFLQATCAKESPLAQYQRSVTRVRLDLPTAGLIEASLNKHEWNRTFKAFVSKKQREDQECGTFNILEKLLLSGGTSSHVSSCLDGLANASRPA